MVCRIAIREHQQGGHQRRFVMRGVHDDRSRPTDPLSLPPDLLSKHCLSMSVDLPRTDGRSALDQRPVAMSVEDNRAITIRLSVPVQVDIKPFFEQCKIHCIDPINIDKNFLYLGWPQLGGDRREREREGIGPMWVRESIVAEIGLSIILIYSRSFAVMASIVMLYEKTPRGTTCVCPVPSLSTLICCLGLGWANPRCLTPHV